MSPQFEAIGLISSDLERSVGFYRQLGLEFPEPIDAEGHGHVEAQLPGGLRFMLDTIETIKSFDPDWEPPSGGHRSAIAFRCGSPPEVDAAYATLLEHGGTAHKEPWDAFWGMRYAQVKDPDGNLVDLFADLS
jgi:catechol 2,3-dioxygenase-like lactoylglutathione lyase family enzyme